MKKYEAFTLLELIIVMVIFVILSTIGVVTYRGLVDAFSTNEASLKIMQDIRSVQRSAMMVDRESDERWLYGIGIDFTRLGTHKEYKVFKWCSEFDEYSYKPPSKVSRELPNLSDYTQEALADAKLHEDLLTECPKRSPGNGVMIMRTESLNSYENLEFTLTNSANPALLPVRYVLFESVSGKAFFYDSSRNLLNYRIDGGVVRIAPVLELLEIKISPTRGENPTTRSVKVRPVSGLVYFDINTGNGSFSL